MQIGGFQKFSLIDFPDKIAAIVFTQGCNFRCPYCHNPELVSMGDGCVKEEEIIEFLKTRQGKLDGVVITGGEPTLQKDLIDFCAQLKELGFLVKLDTNGTNPRILELAIQHKLVDYIAMDIKTSLENYETVTRVNLDIEQIKKSIDIIKSSKIKHEFRTTTLKDFVQLDNFKHIAPLVNGSNYYLQKFVPSKMIDNSLTENSAYSEKELENIKNDVFSNSNLLCIR